MSRFLYIRNRIFNLGYLIEALLDVPEPNQDEEPEAASAVIMYFNHPIQSRCEVRLEFCAEEEASAFMLHLLTLLSEDVTEVSDDEDVQVVEI
jgi:hypothetical protein